MVVLPIRLIQQVIAQADIIANNYLQAIERSGVKRVVYLSSIGAEMNIQIFNYFCLPFFAIDVNG
jgi:hypothetical protein